MPIKLPATAATSAGIHSWMWDGREFARSEGVPVADRGFRYGMSVFESFPVKGGVAVLLGEHLGRLREACGVVGFEIPSGALEGCGKILEGAPDGFGRVYVTAGDGTVTGGFDACRVIVMVEQRERVAGRVYDRGYDLALHGGAHVSVFGGLKTGNYWGNIAAFREGVAARCNETLLFDGAGHLISACMANVFVVKDGQGKTPALSTGARRGVVREWVMKQLLIRNKVVVEALITRADVMEAEEIFLTSSWIGVMPGAAVDGRALKRSVSAQLVDAYRKENGE